MKYSIIVFALSVLLISCESSSQKEERLAHQYCGSCHTFPNPSLLDKKTWEKHVLPEMAFRMGLKAWEKFSVNGIDPGIAAGVIPTSPMVSDEEWQSIKNYFLTKAPDTLPLARHPYQPLEQFDVSAVRTPIRPYISMLKVDTTENKIFVGMRTSDLYTLDADFTVLDSFKLNSTPSFIFFQPQKNPIVSLMGMMDPNDAWKGELIELSPADGKMNSIIDSLQRPVHFEKADLNNDKLDDYVVCSFGDYTGALLVYENLGNEKFKKHILYNLPGARKVIIRDVNKDGLNDIFVLMTQGDEQLSLLTNTGNFNFRITTLLRFPPVYGSSYFDIADFNQDGYFDILYTNGDNADFSTVLKFYHGIRIFTNNGKNEFAESEFLQMHGASQACTADFDQDGDLDIAAVAFFPDLTYHPEQGFVYFENTAKGFIRHTTPQATEGRWLVMDAADVDDDGDTDVLLGAFDLALSVPMNLLQQWHQKNTSILLLRNKQIDHSRLTVKRN